MYDERVYFRCDKEMKLYLLGLDDYASLMRDLVTKHRIAQRDPQVINARLKELEKQIRELKQGQTKAKDQLTETQILQKYFNIYKSGRMDETDPALVFKWVQQKVLPELQKAGYMTYDAHQVINKFAGMDK